jgi:uncharacterized membrane protein YqaE (UPF0057 family)
MIYLIAIILPWLALMVRGLVGQGILCLILQLTVIGWIPAIIWAIVSINSAETKKRHDELMRTVMNTQAYQKPINYRTAEEKARLYDEMMKTAKRN